MIEDKEKEKYNKWKSRRWLLAVYLMVLLAGCLFGNAYIKLPKEVLITLIGSTSTYFMVFTGFETRRKTQDGGK